MAMKMKPTRVITLPERKRIRPDQKLPLDLDDRERELILQHTFPDDQLTRRLRIVPRAGKPAVYRFTLGELDDLAGYVAAEANHAKEKKLKKQLACLFGRIQAMLESYTDEDE
jgi:hypothetical protein